MATTSCPRSSTSTPSWCSPRPQPAWNATCRVGTSLFEAHKITIVSIDFIKSDRHRDDFLRACPDLVIVDEAHTCADPAEGSGSRHQRHRLLEGLAADEHRHLILVTATPHSGKNGAFRSLLALLDPAFANLGDDLVRGRPAATRPPPRAAPPRRHREATSGDTPFPDRERVQESYALSPEYSQLFDDVLELRSRVRRGRRRRHGNGSAGGRRSACCARSASSPAAAAATLTHPGSQRRSRRRRGGRRDRPARAVRRRQRRRHRTDRHLARRDPAIRATRRDHELARQLRTFAERADALRGDADAKVVRVAKMVKRLLADGYHPIVFCRFIDTAEYVAEELRQRLPKAVRGRSRHRPDPAGRARRPRRTGSASIPSACSSPPTASPRASTSSTPSTRSCTTTCRGTRPATSSARAASTASAKPRRRCRVATFVGKHIVDRIVEEVLIDKHLQIRRALGVSVPVPATSGEVLEALTDRLLTAQSVEESAEQLALDMPEVVTRFEDQWQSDADREQASRTRFAQHTIKVDEVQRELEATHEALGDRCDLARFVADSVTALDGARRRRARARGTVRAGCASTCSETPLQLRDRLPLDADDLSFVASFSPPGARWRRYCSAAPTRSSRHSPVTSSTPRSTRCSTPSASRAGVIRTDAVDRPHPRC